MKESEQRKLEASIRAPEYDINTARDRQVLETLLSMYRENQQPIKTIGRLKMIMKYQSVKAAVIALAFLMVVGGLWLGGPNKVWALEQVLTALENVKSVHIQGTILYGREYEPMPCELWVQAPGEDSGPLRIRLECRKRIYVIEGERAFECRPEEGVATLRYGPDIKDFKYWYDMATYSPWFTSRMVRTLRNIFSDWEQSVTVDPETHEERISVSCHYVPTDISLRVEIDGATGLITNAKLYGEGAGDVPFADMPVFEYNQEVPPGTFELPVGTRVIDHEAQRKVYALFVQALELFQEKETCEEAMDLYQEICDTYPYPTQDENVAYAQQMIGLCYRKLGQPLKEIEAYEKAVQAGLAHWTHGDLYMFLGRACMEQGLDAKALNAFENCLRDCPGHQDYEQFPIEQIQQWISELKARVP